MKRKIITIDEAKCNGCGECIPNCPEGAIRIVGGKAKLVSDVYCDGLGACLGRCPQGAIAVEEREAEKYDERKVMENVIRQGEKAVRDHLEHLKSHGEEGYRREALAILKEKGIPVPAGPATVRPAAGGCPSARIVHSPLEEEASSAGPHPTRLKQWPVQLNLVPPHAPFLAGADLLVAADCVPVAYAGFHDDLLRGRRVVVGCPKFDDREAYRERLANYFRNNEIKSVTVARMEVPCCGALHALVEEALKNSGKKIPLWEVIIGINGEKQLPVSQIGIA
jgi:ferredoxin